MDDEFLTLCEQILKEDLSYNCGAQLSRIRVADTKAASTLQKMLSALVTLSLTVASFGFGELSQIVDVVTGRLKSIEGSKAEA